MWHASVSLRGPDGFALPLDLWGEEEHQAAREAARRLLRGVGIGEEIWKAGEVALHLRRRVHPAEMPHQATDVRGGAVG